MNKTHVESSKEMVPGGYEGLGEKLSFIVKVEIWDLVPGEAIKFNDGREKL